MGTIIRKSSFFLILICVGLMSCESNKTVYQTYKTLENGAWGADDAVTFDFQINDTISKNNLYINLRNNNSYGYSNLYLITDLDFPDGRKIVDTLQYRMTDNEGNFLGSGFSEIKENKLFYKEEKVFPVSGAYRFSVRQAMRKNGAVDQIKELKGITDVGFKIEKIE